jgi:hypothetical protein
VFSVIAMQIGVPAPLYSHIHGRDDGSMSSGGGTFWSWALWTAAAVAAVFMFSWVLRQLRAIRGPIDTGHAKVLSLRRFGFVGSNDSYRAICRLRLRIEVAGREPYDATVWQNVPPWNIDAVQVGRTVGVDVSAANPKRARLNLAQPVPGGSWRGGTTRFVYNSPPNVVINYPHSADGARPSQQEVNLDSLASVLRSIGVPNSTAMGDVYKHNPGAVPVVSAAELLATGQRVPGVIKAFASLGTTPRTLGRVPSMPELIDAPHYMLEVELHFPNLGPVDARAVHAVPPSQVPMLSIGRRLNCAVDPEDPARRFVVDWGPIC